jgi:5-carboxymethyl-2-hydroxymuconate isomerase
MPHGIISYSREEDRASVEQMLSRLYQVLCDSSLFEMKSVKVRAQSYWTLTGMPQSYHVEVKILSGRTVDQRATLAKAIHVQLIPLASGCPLSIEITEMERSVYQS